MSLMAILWQAQAATAWPHKTRHYRDARQKAVGTEFRPKQP
jgi:hypothetical protein